MSAKTAEAVAQLRRYLTDGRLARRYPNAEFKGLMLVFRGWELVKSEEVTVVAERPYPPQSSSAKRRRMNRS